MKIHCSTLALSALMLVGCFDQGSTLTTAPETDQNQPFVTSKTVLSDPDQDPYTPKNMSKALNSLVAKRAAQSGEDTTGTTYALQANYLYVRFLANGKRGAAELKQHDTDLVLFDHPLDYKPLPKRIVYRDPSLPDSIIPLFASVPIGYSFGSTPYEVIKELFLTEPFDDTAEDESTAATVSSHAASQFSARQIGGGTVKLATVLKDNKISLDQIQLASLLQTGNLSESRLYGSENAKSFGARSQAVDLGQILSWSWTRWRPSGTLKFEDDQLGDQPLVGVRVTAGYSYYWRSSVTDGNGYFQSPERWTYSVDYEANFDCNQFLLEDGHSIYGEDLEIEKNSSKSAWNETFKDNHAKWSVIWTGAHQYYYGDVFGLKRPRENGYLNFSLDIQVYDGIEETEKYIWFGPEAPGWYFNIVVADWIEISTKGASSKSLYEAVMHELTHSVHYEHLGINWWEERLSQFGWLSVRMRESFAAGFASYFAEKRYPGWKPRLFNSSGKYSGIIVDLYDGDNVYAEDDDKGAPTGDAVSGFTPKQIQDTWLSTATWEGFKSKLKADYPSGSDGRVYTDNDYDNLFAHWEN